MIFVAETLRVHTALMLSVTQIGTIPLRSKKWSEVISKYISQNVNNMKQGSGTRNKEVVQIKVFQLKFYFFFCPIKIFFLVRHFCLPFFLSVCYP